MKSRSNMIKKSKLLMKTSSSMQNIFSQKINLNLNDFGIFTKYMDKQLSYYNLNPKELCTTKSIFNKTGIKINENEKFGLKTTKAKNSFFGIRNTKDFNNTKEPNQSLYNKTYMTVSIKNNFYDNPSHSYNILKKNFAIAHDIVNQNIIRQKSVYKATMNKIKLNKVFFKKKMPHMKISTIMPNLKKEYVFFSLKNPPVEINPINNNNDNNANGIPGQNNNIQEQKKINNSRRYAKNFKSDSSFNIYSKLICLYRYSNKNFPESREQFSLTLNENNLYLIGGKKCIFAQEELWTCDLSTVSWSKVKSTNSSFARFGHSAVLDKNGSKIYLYGGRTKYDQNPESGLSKTYIYCGLEYYDLKTKEFNKPVMSYRIQPEYRRNHIAELVGNDLVIMGGINENNEILNDVHSLNLNFPNGIKERWKEVEIATSDVETPFLFGHASALAVQSSVSRCNKFSLYKYPDDERIYKLGVFIDKIKIKGLYIFGGKSKAVGTGGITNDLYVLVLGKKPCVWKKLENTKGVKPPPRYFHSMSYYEKGNILIVHGGRNDLNSDSFALNDTYIFDLEFLQWHRVTLYSNIEGFKVMPRCAHRSVVHGNKLIIFGGMNNQNYIGSCLFIIRLDPDSFEKNRLMVSSENENDYL